MNLVTGTSMNLVTGTSMNLVTGTSMNLVTGTSMNLVTGTSMNLVTGTSMNIVTGTSMTVMDHSIRTSRKMNLVTFVDHGCIQVEVGILSHSRMPVIIIAFRIQQHKLQNKSVAGNI